jgi:PAS domain S-box-containing protein
MPPLQPGNTRIIMRISQDSYVQEITVGNNEEDLSRGDNAQTALDEPELHFAQLVQDVRDCAIFLLDVNGNVLTWNRGAEKIKRYRPQEILGRHFSFFYTPEAIKGHKPQRGLEIARREGHFEDEGWRIRGDGTRFWASVTITWVPGNFPASGRFLKITRDLTARKEIEAANYAKDRILAMLSHELRTPLTPIVFASSMLIDDPSVPEAVREQIGTIAKNAKLLTRLVDDLLDATKLTAGKLRLKFAIIDAHALLRSVADMLAADIEAKQLALSMELGASNHVLGADPDRLQQVFWNLLKNAVKFTSPGGNIWMRSSNPDNTTFRVEFQDSGNGIPPTLLPRIFAPFEQGEASEGLGLGLAISKNIVDLHGGRITATSPGSGKGATFKVELPAPLVMD